MSDEPGFAPRQFTAPAVVDHHVHLGLVDWRALVGSPLGEVHDLGWDPTEIDRIGDALVPDVRVRRVGPFHTAPGGYPSGRSWAPATSIVTIGSPDDATRAVAAAAARGAHGIKIALNAAMPLLTDATLRGLVDSAHGAGLRAFVHAEGAGQAERAIAAGADVLVHTPWTEALSDESLRLAVASGMVWISTLAIHEGAALELALDNAQRYLAHGGSIVYGTDMGNGDLPVGLNAREVQLLGRAGLSEAALHAALFSTDPRDAHALTHSTPLPDTADALAEWLATATRRPSTPTGESA